jgi:hypothetical protein
MARFLPIQTEEESKTHQMLMLIKQLKSQQPCQTKQLDARQDIEDRKKIIEDRKRKLQKKEGTANKETQLRRPEKNN